MATSPRKLEADDTPGPLTDLNPEALVDEVPAGVDYKKLMADEKFLSEQVLIFLHPLSQEQNEPAVPVSVQGDRVYIVPGIPTKVKRYHLARLIQARPDYIAHVGGDQFQPQSTHNRLLRQSTSRYNFEVLEDTPQGIAWTRELRRQFTRR